MFVIKKQQHTAHILGLFQISMAADITQFGIGQKKIYNILLVQTARFKKSIFIMDAVEMRKYSESSLCHVYKCACACVYVSHFSSGLPCSLGLSSHSSLQLQGQFNIFNLHPLHLDAPVISRIIQSGLEERTGRDFYFICYIYARTMNIRTDSSKKKNYDKVAKQLFYMILIKKVSET